jgi:hypothetical protein
MVMVDAFRRNKPAGLAAGLATRLAIVPGLLIAASISLSAAAQTPAASGVPAPGTTQPTAQPLTDASKQKTAKHHPPGKAHSGKAAVEPVPLAETQPVVPPMPKWPVNDAPVPASVAWNGRDLSIAASNASLDQILHDVSTATGLKVEGLADSPDKQNSQRIYGSYGPASERDVLSQLLEGSGYNVLMIGNQNEGAPRELVLTAKTGNAGGAKGQPGGVKPNQAAEEDEPEEPEPVEPQPDPTLRRPPGIPPQPGQGRNPLQELQQRQQLQQQQQQQPGVPVQQPQPQQPNN